MKELNVIGLGYIGLPTALMFAANGIKVVGTDLNTAIIDKLNNSSLTFKEEGLEELFENAVKAGIKFSNEYINTDKYLIAVPTPYIEETKKIDPKYIIDAIYKVLNVCNKKTIIIIESTISPGTIDKFIRPIIKEKGTLIGKDIHLAHAPERIIPGRMLYELKNNSRVIGADNSKIGTDVIKLYKSFCNAEIVMTDIKTAEMSKVVENTYRDINIAFANELVKICRKENIDVYNLIEIANNHPRVNILKPGPGVGGHCISVDPWFLVGEYPNIVNVILAARRVNDSMPQFVIKRIRSIMIENNISDFSKVGLYGLTYKENVDDMRKSPTIQLINNLEEDERNKVKIYDSLIKEKKYDNQYMNFENFINDIDFVVIMIGHNHIIKNYKALENKILLDTRNILNIKKSYKL